MFFYCTVKRNSFGVLPVFRLKYCVQNEGFGKFSRSETC